MPKSKSSVVSHLPIAPWIYINDPSGTHMWASELAKLIPNAIHFTLSQTLSETADLLDTIKHATYRGSILIVSNNTAEDQKGEKHVSQRLLKEASIKRGCNFASINLYTPGQSLSPKECDVNHIALTIHPDCCTQIYQWLFTVFTIPEQLYLIPDSQMKHIDQSSGFKDYEYCSIADSHKHPKNTKLQFVALVLSKPEVGPNQRLRWKVIDKTGMANFYFQYRGPYSQYTWDWVLALKPGDRRCLPRMPCVEIKERAITTIAKAPFRVSAAVIHGTGATLSGIGKGLCKAGKKVKLGNRSQWVPEADVTTDAKGRKVKISPTLQSDKYAKVKPVTNKTEIKVFSEKGEKMWKDDDSVISTAAGSVIDEKQTEDFV